MTNTWPTMIWNVEKNSMIFESIRNDFFWCKNGFFFFCVTKVYFLHFIKWQKFNSLCDPWWVLAVKSVPVMKQSWDPTVSKNILAGWFHLLIDMRKKYYCLSENLELVSIPPISGFVLDEKLQNFLFKFCAKWMPWSTIST